jgi:hypothetical protein
MSKYFGANLKSVRTLLCSSLNLARNLNPGGWLEVKDIKFPIEDNDNSFPEDCAIKKWAELVLEGTRNLGRPADTAKDYKAQLIEAGFENVVEVRYKWPQNKWPKDPKLKELGKLAPCSHFGP